MTFWRSFSARLTLALIVLLSAFGALVTGLSIHAVGQYQDEGLQRTSAGLARHIVENWPEITAPNRDAADRQAREALLRMLRVVNPGVQVYVLDAGGRVDAYIGQPGMVRRDRVDLSPVRKFLAGEQFPLRGTDPMGTPDPRLFSAAMFPSRTGDAGPPGYLYIVLDGGPNARSAAQLRDKRIWEGAAVADFVGFIATILVGLFAFRRMTLPLDRLARRMRRYSQGRGADEERAAPSPAPAGDEIAAIEAAFAEMTTRIEGQNARERDQAAAHRQTMAGVAHDLRTPLTVLHGHLEVLADPSPAQAAERKRVVAVALAQSDKVRRLTQQLFELATLQSTDEIAHRERFRLDELVSDVVGKFDLADSRAPVRLGSSPPGAIEIVGDLHLIERALTNLIDNALRHAPTPQPMRVGLRRDGGRAEILFEDDGPGLPSEILRRLNRDLPVRDPLIAREGGGMGGLGLAIAQRVAALHQGRLHALPAPQGGTRLCMSLPLAE